MDRRDIADRWDKNAAWNSTTGQNNQVLGQNPVAVLVCPDDFTAVGQPGGLSYVANHGYAEATQSDNLWVQGGIDWDADAIENVSGAGDLDQEDSDLHRSLGVFWMNVDNLYITGFSPTTPEEQGPTPARNTFTRARSGKNSTTIDDIYDGGSQTIMFTENVNAGGAGSWASPQWENVGFAYRLTAPTTPDAALDYRQPERLRAPADSATLINRAKNGPEATLVVATVPQRFNAAPNSAHPGGVNMAMCDGSVRFIGESIDEGVYAKLISPAGARRRGTFAVQDVLNETSF
jgi:prepilin-type processing-associated H-X9-DG protein